MEQHGKNPNNKSIAIIPARYDSSRLKGKLLLPLGSKPVILHTLDRVAMSQAVDDIVVATDSTDICDVVRGAGFKAVMTSADHESGTDRIAEAVGGFPDFEYVVNVQGDEPFVSPDLITSVLKKLQDNATASMATAFERVNDSADVLDPNCVKVVVDANDNCLYFSRSPVPFPRDAVPGNGNLENALESDHELKGNFRKHIGLYVYRRSFLIEFSKYGKTELEEIEKLEQLRALEMGVEIVACEYSGSTLGIDTASDYKKAVARIAVT